MAPKGVAIEKLVGAIDFSVLEKWVAKAHSVVSAWSDDERQAMTVRRENGIALIPITWDGKPSLLARMNGSVTPAAACSPEALGRVTAFCYWVGGSAAHMPAGVWRCKAARPGREP